MIARILLRLSPALVAGACAASQCDPGSAGFFGGVGCAVGSGGYQQRTATLQNMSASAQQNAALSEANAAFEERNATAAQAQTAALKRQVAQMQAGQADLRRRLAAAAQRRGTQDAAYQRAQANVNALEAQLRLVQNSASPNPPEVQRLNAQRQAVLDELGSL
jgi:chromosome segregation ATPase